VKLSALRPLLFRLTVRRP